MSDQRFMRRAISLAKRAWGRTSPNPLVGAVIVRDGEIIAEGWHKKAGEAHAEIMALQVAGKAACGASLFVSLEPCSSQGRTGPCVDAIIAAGCKEVIIGSLDPNPDHQGRAVDKLRDAGISVRTGVLADDCARLNEAFNAWIRDRRPYVTLKMAMTLDGKIATASGDSQWITGQKARKHVQKLRQWADAILVGAETVRQDNPQLIVRSPKNWPAQPLRLIASRSGDLADAQILTDGLSDCRMLNCPDKRAWESELSKLGEEGITALLVEGGGELAAELLQHGLVDKVNWFIAPKLLTGKNSRPVTGGKDPQALSEAYELADVRTRKVGDDLLLEGYLSDRHVVDKN